MSNRRNGTFQRHLTKKAKREAKSVARGVAREGKKIASGTVNGFLNVSDRFR